MSAAGIPFASPDNPRHLVVPLDASEADLLRLLDALGGPPESLIISIQGPTVRRMAAAAVTPAHAVALRQYFDSWLGMWSSLPAALWPAATAGDPDWMAETVGAIRGLQRPTELHLQNDMDAAQLDRLLEVAVASPHVTLHYQGGGKVVASFVARAKTPEQIAALVEGCGPFRSVHELLGAMTPTQLAWAKEAWWSRSLAITGSREIDGKWNEVRYHFLCRLGVTKAEFAQVADRLPGQLFSPPSEAPYASLLPQVQGVLDEVRAWVGRALDGKSTSFLRQYEGAPDFMPLWAVVLTGPGDDLVTRMMKRLEENKGDYRKERERDALTTFLGESLVSNAHGEAILAAMGKATKAKTLQQVFTAALGVLAGARGRAGQGAIAWANTETYAGAQMIAAMPDPAAYMTTTIATADVASALGLFLATTRWLLIAKPEPAHGLEIIRTQLLRLEQIVDETTPTHVGPYSHRRTLEDTLADAWLDAAHALGSGAEAALRAIHGATTNERFGRLIAPLLGERHGQKLANLAAQLANHPSTLVTRRYAERTEDRPGPRDINRMYGSPVGITAATWPRTRAGVPMQHLLTLETRTLSDDARRELGASVAVAVFLAAIDDPMEGAVVLLSADVIAQPPVAPLVAPTKEGVRLDILELRLPRAVFLGGKKTGVMKELRTALDHLDGLVQTDSTSARWIQEPEWKGPLVVQIDESFDSSLNLGDAGSLYVFASDVVFQSH